MATATQIKAASTLPKTIRNILDGGGTIEEAFTAYCKTAGARDENTWGKTISLSKFKKRFGTLIEKRVGDQPEAAPVDVVGLLLAALAKNGNGAIAQAMADAVDEDDDEVEVASDAVPERAVKPENIGADPTNGMTYKLVKMAQDAGLSYVVIPVFRGACSNRISAVVNESSKAKKRNLLTQPVA